mmetsp:Transcript_16791/g.36475  ORF Transcript_16791/g.36475 Transcript_16791/m.36475 type:complete len:674 (+) Transcript_16791:129-2150(+)
MLSDGAFASRHRHRQPRRNVARYRFLASAMMLVSTHTTSVSAFTAATGTGISSTIQYPGGNAQLLVPISSRCTSARLLTRDVSARQPQGATTALNLYDIAAFDIDDATTKLTISFLLAAAAVAGAIVANNSDDSSTGTNGKSLDEKYTDPHLLAEEYRAREEALKLAMEQEEELTAAEERGEYNKERADVELVNVKLAETGSDPAGIQAPSEDELEVRRMIAEQRELEKRGVFDHDIPHTSTAGVLPLNKDVETGERPHEGLELLKMAEAAKAEDEARGKFDVARDITKVDGSIEKQARDILRIEFAEMEEKDRQRQKAEGKRLKDLEEGQRLLDMAAEARQADTDRLASIVRKDNIEMETDAGELQDERLQFELAAAQDRYGLGGDAVVAPLSGGDKAGEYEETEEEIAAKAKAKQKLDIKKDRYLKEAAERKARSDVELRIRQDADMLEKERLGIEMKIAERRALDEHTKQEVQEEYTEAAKTEAEAKRVAQIEETERAVQVARKKAAVAKTNIEAEKASELESKRAEIAKAEIARDMDMVKRYVEEKKENNSAAMAEAEAKRMANADAKRIAKETAAADVKADAERAREEKMWAKTASYRDIERRNDVSSDVWVTTEEEEILEEAKVALKDKPERKKKRGKVAEVLKSKRVVAAGLLYVVGKKLFNTFLM